jgi:hypothetical protein
MTSKLTIPKKKGARGFDAAADPRGSVGLTASAPYRLRTLRVASRLLKEDESIDNTCCASNTLPSVAERSLMRPRRRPSTGSAGGRSVSASGASAGLRPTDPRRAANRQARERSTGILSAASAAGTLS